MLKKLWELASLVFTLAQDVKQFRQEQKEMRQELRDLTIIVHALAQDNKHTKEQAASDHARLVTELENRLLRFEKLLPPERDKKRGGKR